MSDKQGFGFGNRVLGRSVPNYDLYSWAVSLGVTVPVLRAVIAEVGDSAVAVRQRLRRDAKSATSAGAAATNTKPIAEQRAPK